MKFVHLDTKNKCNNMRKEVHQPILFLCSSSHNSISIEPFILVRHYCRVLCCYSFLTALLRYNWCIMNCMYLMYKILWVWTYTNTHDIITTTDICKTYPTPPSFLVFLCFFFSVLCVCVYVLRTHNVRSAFFTNFEVTNTIFLTISTMLYSRSLELFT